MPANMDFNMFRHLKMLYKMCGRHALLPGSMQVVPPYNRADIPYCRGGFSDVWGWETRRPGHRCQGYNNLPNLGRREENWSEFLGVSLYTHGLMVFQDFCKEASMW